MQSITIKQLHYHHDRQPTPIWNPRLWFHTANPTYYSSKKWISNILISHNEPISPQHLDISSNCITNQQTYHFVNWYHNHHHHQTNLQHNRHNYVHQHNHYNIQLHKTCTSNTHQLQTYIMYLYLYYYHNWNPFCVVFGLWFANVTLDTLW